MKKFYILTLLFLHTLTTVAQFTRGDVARVNVLTNEDRFQFINPIDNRDVPIIGERFFYDSIFRPGELKTTKKLYTNELMYRFDQLERTVQIQMEDGKRLLLFEKDIEYCKLFIEKDTVLFIPILIPNERKLTVVQVIYQSPTLQLYRDVRKFLYRVKSANLDGYSSEKIYDDIRKDYHYYFRKDNESDFMEVKADAKSFVKVMPEKRTKVISLFRAAQKGGMTLPELAKIMVELDKKDDLN